MEILEFELSGSTAFFKIPSVNSYNYYSFMCIHKVALLGIFGAILGYKGYNTGGEKIPEFYKNLKDLKVSIEMKSPQNIRQKIQVFNNSVGYASYENGNNLIVREQWLENPRWIIRLLIDESTVNSQKLKDYILESKCVFVPYLGKNDHFANIINPKIVEGEEIKDLQSVNRMASIFYSDLFKLKKMSHESYLVNMDLPQRLDDVLNNYELTNFSQTNEVLDYKNTESNRDFKIVKIDLNNYMFF